MKRCNINLGRDWIKPVRTRYRIYRAMQIYLTISGMLLIMAVYDAGLNIRQASKYREEAHRIREPFHLSTSGRYSLLHYANQLLARIDKCTQQTQAVQEALPSSMHTVLTLLNFLISQSDGGILNNLVLIQDSGKPPLLEFSLAAPGDGGKNSGHGFLQDWQKTPELAKCFSSITPVTTRKGGFGDSDVLIVNYKAVFEE